MPSFRLRVRTTEIDLPVGELTTGFEGGAADESDRTLEDPETVVADVESLTRRHTDEETTPLP